jgi:hypothetical protein
MEREIMGPFKATATAKIAAPGISGIQLARDSDGKSCWYALLDFQGYTFRTDLYPTEAHAQEALDFAMGTKEN